MAVIEVEQPTPTSSLHAIKFPNTQDLRQNIVKWINANLTSSPEFGEFQRKRLEYTVYDDPHEGLADFKLSPELARQYAVVTGFIRMQLAQRMLSQCEYYFRRFPFRGLSVSRAEHLQNVCEFYFSTFCIIRSRIKTTLNNLKAACPDSNVKVGIFLQAFDKVFDHEIRVRNQVHHHVPFDNIELNRISITGVVSECQHSEGTGFWRMQHRTAYRRFSKQWSLRVRHQATIMEVFVEAIAHEILEKAAFLRFPADTRTAKDSDFR
jgi:hypothetical protein